MLDDRIDDVYDFRYHEELSKDLNLGMSFRVNLVGTDEKINIEEVLLLG